MNYQFISTAAELDKACSHFLKEKIIGVDIEADSMHCFKEKICLIQMACAGQSFLIDPFEMKEIDPFLKVLENPEIVKIFHGSDFDIRSLDRDYGIQVNNLFDTEIACRFLGVKERGLAALLKKHFNVIADKRFQKEDWSKRPLRPEMINYSVMDVVYLEKLYQILSNNLDKIKRFSWAKEEFEIQTRVRYENNNIPPLFRKFKGAGKMDNRSLAVLENLLQVRLDIAKAKNRPMFKVLSNQSLKNMAEQKPISIAQMIDERILSKKQADMYGKKCATAIGEAMALDPKDLPFYPKIRRPKKDVRIQKRITLLKKMREKLSESMNIEPGFLLNNALITSIAVDIPGSKQELCDLESIRNWQVDALGENILNILSY
ncbi:MAG: SinI family restriction endonuclease [Desulfobacula sp.]|nr:SinI family restriction endonuclease [Desulfobacula sp.]